MRATQIIFALVSFASVAFADPDPLRIEVYHIPSECPLKSQKRHRVSVHYTGTLAASGSKFDSSRDRNKPFEFILGVGQVIQGLDQGPVDMCVGEKRKLTVPPHLAYAWADDHGYGRLIPARSTLVFDVELLEIKKRGFRYDWL
ncbi:Peptidyl-prolyl cis-trans isomerase fpr2 [Ceratobasidium sp. 394]|nr:Peptidyl-prolyl cis-trans isomerase fpr2 [Ceratobasidium sp. 394]